MEKLRRDRTEKLQFSDWRACSDVTMSNEWKAYRQALRDLPANTSDPKNLHGQLSLQEVSYD